MKTLCSTEKYSHTYLEKTYHHTHKDKISLLLIINILKDQNEHKTTLIFHQNFMFHAKTHNYTNTERIHVTKHIII